MMAGVTTIRAPRAEAEPAMAVLARRGLRDLEATETKLRDLGETWVLEAVNDDGAELAGEKEEVAAAIDDSNQRERVCAFVCELYIGEGFLRQTDLPFLPLLFYSL